MNKVLYYYYLKKYILLLLLLLLLLSLLLSLLLLSMMTLITGFTCPPTMYFKFITKCDKCYYKVRQYTRAAGEWFHCKVLKILWRHFYGL